jgi:hypothetical protein
MTNGEKQKFSEQVKMFFKLVFSPEIMREVAADMQREYNESRRNAALEKKDHGGQHDPDLNHCAS